MNTDQLARREFLGGMAGVMAAMATGGCASMTTSSAPPVPKLAYVGCYTTKERNGHGEGINVYGIDPTSGAWTYVQLVKNLVNPSWLLLDRRHRFLYSAHGDGELVSVFRIDEHTGQISPLGTQAAKGKNGVHLGVDASNKFIVVANYSSGSVAVLPINADGSLGPLTDLVELQGRPGPHRTEQASSHPHEIVFDPRGRFIIVPDKGLDATFVFTLDPTSGKLTAASPPSVASRPGAGPRHADFHPTKPYVYVINELDSTITSGTLTSVGWEPTQGKTPRFFAIEPSGTFLYAANQDSDTIVTFGIDQGSGKLTPTGHVVKTGSPSTIVFR